MPATEVTTAAVPTNGRRLAIAHRDELYRSGLSDETIAESKFYSTDAATASRLLNWTRPGDAGDYLAIPCYGLDGNLMGHRCKPPIIRNGRKYFQPTGVPPFPYFTPAFADRDGIIVITEGEKKILAAHEVGFRGISLPGIWNWQKKDEQSRRILIPHLRRVDWRDQEAVIAFDNDVPANAAVRHAACELARVLQNDHGAIVSFLWLPTDGATKGALDDHLFAHGADSLRHHIESATKGKTTVSLDDYREQMRKARQELPDTPTIYFDRSEVGSGKTQQDIQMFAASDQRTLIVVPSHRQGDEIEGKMQKMVLSVKKYPVLRGPRPPDPENPEDEGDEGTCQNYAEAEDAMNLGFSPSQAVCWWCPFRAGCVYHGELAEATRAQHAIATHARAQRTLTGMADDRQLIAIHEDAVGVLSPTIETDGGFDEAIKLAKAFFDKTRPFRDSAIHESHEFANQLVVNALALQEAFESEHVGPIPMPDPMPCPLSTPARLYHLVKHNRGELSTKNLNLLLAFTEGRLRHVAALNVTKPKGKSSRQVMAVGKMDVPPHASCWFGDAHATADQVRRITGREVIDITPPGVLEQQHAITQVCHDVRKGSKPERALAVLRSVMCLHPDAKRIGVITHKKFVPHIDQSESDSGEKQPPEVLEPSLRERIVKASHFNGTDSRGSNEWMDTCDLLIVLGTPRPNETMVTHRLIQLGYADALSDQPAWMSQANNREGSSKTYGWYWSGVTQSGKRRTVRTANYGHHKWREAYDSLCRTELEQAIGRARSILESGIPAIVATKDEAAGAVLLDEDPPLIDKRDADLLSWISQRGVVRARDITGQFDSPRTGRDWITRMVKAGAIKKEARGKYTNRLM